MNLTVNYQAKIKALRGAIEGLGLAENDLLAKYEQDLFSDSDMNKKVIFAEVLKAQISDSTEAFFEKRCNLPRFKDSRTAPEYAIDLILGWLIEDAVLVHIEKRGLDVALNGNDRNREFLAARMISTQPDLKITKRQKSVTLEIFADWKDTWAKFNHIDLRENKYMALQKEGALMLGIAPNSRKGFLFDFRAQNYGFQYGIISAYGGKPGYTMHGINDKLCDFEQAVNQLVEKVECL